MKVYDTCYSPYRAVAAANDFYPQFSSMYCNETSKLKLGIVGSLTSMTSKPVAELTANFPAPMISPQAASPELSDKSTYPYYMRTVPSSAEQSKVHYHTSFSLRNIILYSPYFQTFYPTY